MDPLTKRLDLEDRLSKALEVQKGLRSMNLHEGTCHSLTEFSKILNDWVKTDKHYSGSIEIPEIKRKLVYQLMEPKNTVVKLSKI